MIREGEAKGKFPSTNSNSGSVLVKDEGNDQNHFYISHGIRKRKIYYHCKYSQEQKNWIKQVRYNLKKQKNIDIDEKQVLLRYFYSCDLNMEKCMHCLQGYKKWFTDPQIQNLSKQAKQIIKTGYVYSYDYSLDGHPFAIMEMGRVDLQKYKLNSYLQAMNYVSNLVVSQKMIKGHYQRWNYILDLNQKFLSLPVTALKEIVSKISQAYSLMLNKMLIINCTNLAKMIYKGIEKMMSEETRKKMIIFTANDVKKGALLEYIDGDILERKFGGSRENIDYEEWFAEQQREEISISQETSYYSLDEDNPMFTKNQSQVCCSTKQCDIY